MKILVFLGITLCSLVTQAPVSLQDRRSRLLQNKVPVYEATKLHIPDHILLFSTVRN
jgi:hypothetical protein